MESRDGMRVHGTEEAPPGAAGSYRRAPQDDARNRGEFVPLEDDGTEPDPKKTAGSDLEYPLDATDLAFEPRGKSDGGLRGEKTERESSRDD